MDANTPGHSDRQLVDRILRGSEAAWQDLVERYAGLILHAVSRVIRDEDDRRTVLADVLEALLSSKLATFRGSARLSTWLVVVARSEACEFVRRRNGRRRKPRGLARLGKVGREVFAAIYEEGLSVDAAAHRLAARGIPGGTGTVIAAISTIEGTVDRRSLNRLAYDHEASTWGVASGRMLEYANTVHAESSPSEGDPEKSERDRELLRIVGLIHRQLAALSEEERTIIRLHCEKGMSAPAVSRRLGLRSARVVYTVVDRLRRSLGRALRIRSA